MSYLDVKKVQKLSISQKLLTVGVTPTIIHYICENCYMFQECLALSPNQTMNSSYYINITINNMQGVLYKKDTKLQVKTSEYVKTDATIIY